MKRDDRKQNKVAFSKWFWAAGVAAVFILIFAVTSPFVQNYRAIQHVESLGGNVFTEPGFLLESLPDNWRKSLKGERLRPFEIVENISLVESSVRDIDLRCFNRFRNLSGLDLGNTQIGNAGLIHLEILKKLEGLSLSDTQVGNAGLVHLKGLINLEYLELCNTQISNAGLSHLKKLTNLKWLRLKNTQIDDAGLIHMKGFTNLKYIELTNTQVSDAGLVHLEGLTNLTDLELFNTHVTAAGVSQLQTALPGCKIKFTRDSSVDSSVTAP